MTDRKRREIAKLIGNEHAPPLQRAERAMSEVLRHRWNGWAS
jgi:hypothetical protein